ncbi:hypothetical protein PlfCFBP13513_08625 [Plantibacter flavus]|uniref:hypothetical protein n=1 Tax=Plantibacter flavus TaxID=150123 RepID=UPI0010C2248D|nr:hypothetical protein [Plantibacter flavus]TKJ99432.1 hypothetical protein PlfCFBP13513_08625 [Plantibacter flavus]
MIGLRAGAAVRLPTIGAQAVDPAAATSGLEGTVVECAEVPYLAKLYVRPRSLAEATAIQQLIDIKEFGLTPSDRDRLARSFSWPAHRILDDTDATIGVLIPRAEARFTFAYEGRWHLRDGQHVTRATSVAGSFSELERHAFAVDVALGWELLDRHRLVYADANSRNLLFAPSGAPSAFFLDCDGIRRENDATLEYRTQANWKDPHSHSATVEADRYLLAVWLLRLLSAQMVRPQPVPGDADALPSVHRRSALRRLISRGLGPPGGRPTPVEYLAMLRT